MSACPSYKDQQEQLKEKDLATYGFLGYPLLQSADILIYRAAYVPVGEDQVAHVELTRETARRFNHLYGREPDFEERRRRRSRAWAAATPPATASCAASTRRPATPSRWQRAQALVQSNNRITVADRERLLGFLEGTGVTILPEPQVLLTTTPKVPGLDGRKMSKSYGNTIGLREEPDAVVAEAARHADRPGARAPHRSGGPGEVPGVGPAQDLFRRGHPHLGAARAAALPASAAWTARSP